LCCFSSFLRTCYQPSEVLSVLPSLSSVTG
jgi:hypothetical protein